MGFFDKILNKLGIGDAKAKEAPAPEAATPEIREAAPEIAPVTEPDTQPAALEPQRVDGAPKTIPVVDVEAKLQVLAAANPQELSWRVSIVDLLKLLGLESSLAVRKDLAVELGCPEDLMADSAKMNMWLHKTVLRKIAENGGNLPQDLLD